MDSTYALQLRRRRMAIRPLQLAPEDQGAVGGVTYGGGGVNKNNTGAGFVRRGGGGGGESGGKVKSASAGLCGGPPNKTSELDF